MKSYERVVAEFRSRVWAIRTETFDSMLELVARWSRGEKFSHDEVEARIQESNARNGMNRGDDDIYREPVMLMSSGSRGGSPRGSSGGIVALIPVIGVLSNRVSMLESISSGGGCSVQALTSQFRQAISNPGVKAIVFDVDSPGGVVDGIFEFSQEIYEARGRKKIIACANTLAASAAYAIAAAASELVVAPSGEVGSIGVFCSHVDNSKLLEREGVKVTLISAGRYKTEANSIEPLSDSARAEIQGKVDDFYQMFIRAVALGRKDSQANVRAGYGQARCLTAAAAVRANLADRVGTLDSVLAGLGIARPGMTSGNQRLDAPEEDYEQAIARRRRQLALLARPGAPDDSVATAHRRMQMEIDLMRMGSGTRRDARVSRDRTAVPDESVGAALRRRRLELDLMRM